MCLRYCVRVFACVRSILWMCVLGVVSFVFVYLCAWQEHDMIRVALETNHLK